MHERFRKEPFTEVRCLPEALSKPLHWRKPRAVFIDCADLFHKDVPDDFIAAVFGVMASTPQHTYLVLTKRADRMRDWFKRVSERAPRCPEGGTILCLDIGDKFLTGLPFESKRPWPLPNVWLGVTAENQAMADERIPLLLATPAAHRWVSAEPLLESIVFNPEWLGPGAIEQVIPGVESGTHRRPCPPVAIPLIVQMCAKRDARCFVKQVEIDGKCVTDPTLFPPGLRVRELAWKPTAKGET
jgi:protein gp37